MNMLRRFCDSLYKLIELRAFVEEGLGPRAQIQLAIGRVRIAAEHHKGNIWRRLAHSAQHLQARATLQLHVQHHHTGMDREDAIDGSLGSSGVADDRQVTALQQAGDSFTDQWGVFDQENFDDTGKGFSHGSTVAPVLRCSHRQEPKITPCARL